MAKKCRKAEKGGAKMVRRTIDRIPSKKSKVEKSLGDTKFIKYSKYIQELTIKRKQ